MVVSCFHTLHIFQLLSFAYSHMDWVLEIFCVIAEAEMQKLSHALRILSEAEKQLRMSKNQTTWLTVALLHLSSMESSSSDTNDSKLCLRNAREQGEDHHNYCFLTNSFVDKKPRFSLIGLSSSSLLFFGRRWWFLQSILQRRGFEISCNLFMRWL